MRFLSVFLLLGCLGLNLQAAEKAATPEALVAELYKAAKKDASPFFQDKDRALVNHYFSKELADLIWKDTIDSKGEVGTLGADPLYDAQDTEIKEFVIHKAKTEEEKTTVLVSFLNFDKKQRLTYHFVQQGGAWKISDIHYSSGYTLMKLLKDNVAK
jgi:uncharacterized protein DUF3828